MTKKVVLALQGSAREVNAGVRWQAECEDKPMAAEFFSMVASEDDFRLGFRRWTGNDENDRHHHGVVPLQNSPLEIRLRWKSTANDKPRSVGLLRLNLGTLLASHYIRRDGNDQVRLRFVHDRDGGVYIQARRDGPRLLVGQPT